jgi:indole-3-glycerol phosphate synthase
VSVLEAILAHKRDEVQARKAAVAQASLERAASAMPSPRGLRRSLERPGIRVIAEVKRVSPAKGALKVDSNASELARTYETGGAAGISVLTDERYFAGRDQDLRDVHATVNVPVLRKDFIFDPYQVWEARALGADAVLLIVRVLSDEQLFDLLLLAERLEMDALVEVHDRVELERAARSGAGLIGINNRDLATLRVDVANTFPLLPFVPSGATIVSESGISSGADTARLAEHGVRAVLVGEALVVSEDAAALLRELMAAKVPA